MTHEIEKVQPHDLVLGGESAVAALFLPDAIGTALQEHGVTPNFIIGEIAEILRSNRITVDAEGNEKWFTQPRDRLAAAKLLLEVAEKSAHVSGLIERITGHAEKQLPDGTRVTLDAESLRLLEEGTSRTLKTLKVLQTHVDNRDVIDLEKKDADRTGDSGPSTTADRTGNILSGSSVGGDGGGCGRESERDESVPGGSGIGGNGDGTAVHEDERSDAISAHSSKDCDDKGPTGGAKDERSPRVSEQPGRSNEGQETGAGRTGDSAGDRSDPEAPEWWNERASPTDVLPPDPKPQPHPFVPGSCERERSVPRHDDKPDSSRGPDSISERLRGLYLKRKASGPAVERKDDRSAYPHRRCFPDSEWPHDKAFPDDGTSRAEPGSGADATGDGPGGGSGS